MKQLIKLHIASDHLRAALHKCVVRPGILAKVKGGFSKLAGNEGVRYLHKAIEIEEKANALNIGTIFEKVTPLSAEPLRGLELHVSLGAEFSKVGVMRIDAKESGGDDVDGLVEAWASQTWALEPGSHIVRWYRESESNFIVVSAIDKGMHTALCDMAERFGLTYTHCVPGLLEAIAAAPSNGLFLMAERAGAAGGSDRSNQVHAVLRRNGATASVLGFWLPAPHRGLDDPQMLSLHRRALAHHGLPAAEKLNVLNW